MRAWIAAGSSPRCSKRSSMTSRCGGDQPHLVHQRVPFGLDEQRRLDHDCRRARRAALAAMRAATASRMSGWTMALRRANLAGSAKTTEPSACGRSCRRQRPRRGRTQPPPDPSRACRARRLHGRRGRRRSPGARARQSIWVTALLPEPIPPVTPRIFTTGSRTGGHQIAGPPRRDATGGRPTGPSPAPCGDGISPPRACAVCRSSPPRAPTWPTGAPRRSARAAKTRGRDAGTPD